MPKAKKCKVCFERFEPMNSFHQACGPTCAVALARLKQKRKWKKQATDYRKRNQPKGEAAKKAQVAFNAYIRTRDIGMPCISCEGFRSKGSFLGGAYDAGHWHGVAAHRELRYKLWNVHRQCKFCNDKLSGHPFGYEAGLRAKFGNEWVEKRKLEVAKTELPQYSIEQLQRIAKIFNAKNRLYKKLFRYENEL